MVTALPLVALVALLLLGVPIAVALAASGMLGIYVVTGDLAKILGIVALTPFDTVADYALTTIPMFILMAYFSASSGLARDLYTAASNWLSLIPGGLAIATVLSCGVFGAMSGASVAAASVMSKIAMPEMRRHGYSEELAAGAIGVGATLDILIPPSVAMVIYGLTTQTSVGKLLIAGIMPGILVGILLTLTIYLWAKISPSHAPETYRVPGRERWASLARVWPSLLLIVIGIALLYLGIATPTEVGAVGALMAGVIGVALGGLSAHGVLEALKSTIRTSAMIFLILIGATLFGHYMTLSRIPQEIVALVTAMDLNRWMVIIGILAVYFVISMFMDEIPLLLLTLQLTFPLITSLGFDPIWFGVVSMMMVAMGLVFPPVGLVAFVVGTTAEADLTKVYKGTSILTIALVVTTVLLIIFPQIALWLPATMR
ncbi:TRAP transporter large permease [Mesorhizobium sp. M6A.T.Ce.TU.002.03.1.1]|uniref:TRAP transporter large permease n=1 Tax=Mesorhizobium sp. M6A.T.Ce.TU.002.03.1.1 TaxID=2496782 RepID=UPI000FCA524D|nr:TRAP transporter large permease [Mesorhizobium sp. M6A.T.Ce.TU.002.03.1.1]RUU43873.1 TRAP transporter large permease [Mesorhizobium sp. M6A.T.Ce.TU.002.03.1.1]